MALPTCFVYPQIVGYLQFYVNKERTCFLAVSLTSGEVMAGQMKH